MKCKAEEPSENFRTPTPLVFEPYEICESTRNSNVLITGWFIVVPLDPPSDRVVRNGEDSAFCPNRTEYTVDYGQKVRKQGLSKLVLNGMVLVYRWRTSSKIFGIGSMTTR